MRLCIESKPACENGRLTGPHQMESFVFGSSTMNLSLGERPVYWAGSTAKAAPRPGSPAQAAAQLSPPPAPPQSLLIERRPRQVPISLPIIADPLLCQAETTNHRSALRHVFVPPLDRAGPFRARLVVDRIRLDLHKPQIYGS